MPRYNGDGVEKTGRQKVNKTDNHRRFVEERRGRFKNEG
jgi:hypothetical protein